MVTTQGQPQLKRSQKILSILVSLALMFALTPMTAWADGEEAAPDASEVEAVQVAETEGEEPAASEQANEASQPETGGESSEEAPETTEEGIQPVGEEEPAEPVVPDSEVEAPYVTDEVIVVFEDDMTPQEIIEQVDEAESLDVQAAELSEEEIDTMVDNQVVMVLPTTEGTTVDEAIEELDNTEGVLYAQPNYCYSLLDVPANQTNPLLPYTGKSGSEGGELFSLAASKYVPNDKALGRVKPYNFTLALMDSNAGANAWHLNNIGAFEAWGMGKDEQRQTTTVAVLDTGCYLQQPDLRDAFWTEYAWDAHSNCPLQGDFGSSNDKHGTHVCGIVGAVSDNGMGTAGVSLNSKILPINVFDSTGKYTYTSDLIAAYNYLLNLNKQVPSMHIRVVNMSLGAYTELGQEDNLLMGLIDKAADQGIATVCAAGNGGTAKHMYPADYRNTIAVTALDSDGVTVADYSDYNANKDICAPGSFIFSTWQASSPGYDYYVMSGTSQAAPVVSGALAFMFSLDPSLTVAKATSILKTTAIASDFNQLGRNGLYGAGRLNMAAAVQQVLSQRAASSSSSGGSTPIDAADNVTPSTHSEQIGTPVPSPENPVKPPVTEIDPSTGEETTVPVALPDASMASSVQYARVGLEFFRTDYTGESLCPRVTSVTAADGTKLSMLTDFSVYYPSDTTNAGTYAITITGKNDYTGTMQVQYSIMPRNISMARVDLPSRVYHYTGDLVIPTIKSVSLLGETLMPARDYQVTYPASVRTGNYKAVIKGRGNYGGQTEVTYSITSNSSTPKVTLSKTKYTYTGKLIKPKVKVMVNGEKLLSSQYTVSYSNNLKVGMGKVKVKLKGDHRGEATATFAIAPPAPAAPKLASGQKALKATWSRASVGMASGYQVRYSRSPSMRASKTATVKSLATTTKRLTKLKGKSKYYVQMRCYKKVGSQVIYGVWSPIVSAKVS